MLVSTRILKRTVVLVAHFLVLILICLSSRMANATVEGTNTADGSGKVTTAPVVGVNISGLEIGSAVPGKAGTDYLVPTNAEFAYYRSKNLMTVRLPFKWERMDPTLSATLDPTYLGYVQTLLGYAAANGIGIIID